MDTTEIHAQLRAYYAARAPVYDRVYEIAERQDDLGRLQSLVTEQFAGLDVLEIAAGTGYWTQFISRKARSIVATDVTPAALDQINRRKLSCEITSRVMDAYKLEELGRKFSGAFAGLWFSHVPTQERKQWLANLHAQLVSGSLVMLLDNSSRQCQQLPICHTDRAQNTYQDRTTDEGVRFRVLKNFPTEQELLAACAELGRNHVFTELEHYWVFQYTAN